MKDITAYKKLNLKITPFSPNHTVICTKYGRAFVSYKSVVAFVDRDSVLTLGPDYAYSRTTMKHLCKWLNTSSLELHKKVASGEVLIDEDL